MTAVTARAASAPRRAARASKPAIRRLWRRAVLARAADDTATAAARTALVVAPHPDDETLGCGGLIARKRAAGTDVTVVVVTDGRHSHRSEQVSADQLAAIRADEAGAACARLGVDPSRLHLLGYEEGTAAAQGEEVTGRLAEIVAAVRPDDVLTTCGADWHLDHQAVSASTRAAVRAAAPGTRLLEFPIWWWVDGPWSLDARRGGGRIWRYLSDPVRSSRVKALTVVTAGYLEAKREALREYRSQTTNLTGEPTWAVMDDDLLSLFLGPVELFLPVEPEGSR